MTSTRKCEEINYEFHYITSCDVIEGSKVVKRVSNFSGRTEGWHKKFEKTHNFNFFKFSQEYMTVQFLDNFS